MLFPRTMLSFPCGRMPGNPSVIGLWKGWRPSTLTAVTQNVLFSASVSFFLERRASVWKRLNL